jgi:phi13 family phage major tail protein
VPVYGSSKHLPGAVSLSIDANGEAENFYADNGVYYVINNNAGYTGDLEIALITTEFGADGQALFQTFPTQFPASRL